MTTKTNSLTPAQKKILQDKGTEPPFSSPPSSQLAGSYLCRQCGLALFRSQSKFDSGCGWPSFDEEIQGAVTQHTDADGRRTEIVCARCQGHLGHVFAGEGFTLKNIRHCVNSLSLEFVEDCKVLDTQEAIFAAGCFWGVEHYFKKLRGVLKTEVGYTGGKSLTPTYEDVCRHRTDHLEALRIVYDPHVLSYEKCVQYFFEIHNFSQTNGQGPDLGPQYLSAIFYNSQEQKLMAKKVIDSLSSQGLSVATQLLEVKPFWIAEDYHQDYYGYTGKEPYCHTYKKIF